jgi:FkbM family methyltransferase
MSKNTVSSFASAPPGHRSQGFASALGKLAKWLTVPRNRRADQARRLEIIERLARFGREIDLVHMDFFYFMYQDDFPYVGTPESQRGLHNRLSPGQIRAEVEARQTSQLYRYLCDVDPVARALMAMSCSGPVNLMYVGVSYGFHLFKLAEYAQKANIDIVIHAFEPGLAGSLMAKNIQINGFSNSIEFHELALSDGDGPAILHQRVGHSEDNKIVNDIANPLRVTRIVETRSLDSFVTAAGLSGQTVIVLDTQGNEPDIIAGAKSFLLENTCVVFSEFTPWSISARLPPQEYLGRLLDYGDVYDAPDLSEPPPQATEPTEGVKLLGEQITAATAESFAQRIAATPPNWTDIAVIPAEARAVRDAFGI